MENGVIPVIIPAYEPDERMDKLMIKLKDAGIEDIVIINDGSGSAFDRFYKFAEDKGAVVLKHVVNMGKGRALKDAFNYCLERWPDMIGCVTADSDGQHTPEDLIKCINMLGSKPDSLILGVRNFDGKDIPAKSVFGNKLTRVVCKVLCGIDISDTQTGLRGIPKVFMETLLNVPGERFEFETNMFIESKDKYSIVEVPIQTIYDSKENHVTHFDPIKDSIKIYKIFGKMFMKFIVSSLSSAVLDLFLFGCFCGLLKTSGVLWYVAVSTIMARIISATYNYIINYKLVFKSNEKGSKALTKYFCLAMIQMFCSAVLVTAGTMIFRLAPEILIKLCVDVILFFISYVIQREFVFANK